MNGKSIWNVNCYTYEELCEKATNLVRQNNEPISKNKDSYLKIIKYFILI